MRPLYIFLLIAFFSTTSFAQTINGIIKDAKGESIPGVSVSIKDSYDGGTTDSTGHFSFATTEKGDKVIVATAIGYKPFEQAVKIEKAAITINITLKEEITELKAVVITAGSFEASDKKKTTVLSSIDIVTTASANADVTGAVKTLPGAQQVGESEGLFVRGGTAQETKTFIDGTLVNNFFYSSVPGIAQRGRFSPFLFKGTVFSAGGYSALYGQALSSALILESIDLPEQSSGSVGLSVIGVNGGYQKL
ncbi:MAG: TonB-dependent receptor, partial [Flaviaesturariibacter sp.]|nr:TonB-dependent receptor [Flaviaesturariibacter sp.]